MAIHSLRSTVDSHRALAKRKKLLALGVVLAAGIAGAPVLQLTVERFAV
jgi:hypothetical protein